MSYCGIISRGPRRLNTAVIPNLMALLRGPGCEYDAESRKTAGPPAGEENSLIWAGRFETVTTDMTFGGYGPKSGTARKVPDRVADSGDSAAWIDPDARQPLRFHPVSQSQPLTLGSSESTYPRAPCG